MLVPSRELAPLPWSALLLDEERGTLLAEVAVLQLLPSLSLLETRPPSRARSRVMAQIDDEFGEVARRERA